VHFGGIGLVEDDADQRSTYGWLDLAAFVKSS
jgi:hypothetical protein